MKKQFLQMGKVGAFLALAAATSTPSHAKSEKMSNPIVDAQTVVTVGSAADIAVAPRELVEAAPDNWVAFLAYQGGFTPAEFYALNKTPIIMLFGDGRLVWRDDDLKWDAPNRAREMWREAKISPDAFKNFQARVEEIDFMAVQPPAPEEPKADENGLIVLSRPVICDAATTILGFRKENINNFRKFYQQRIVSEYALGAFADLDKDNHYIQSLLTMQKMLQDLRPKESKTYQSESIRVTFMNSLSRGSVAPLPGVEVPAWPLTDKPNVESTNIYSGEAAKTLLAQIAKSPLVKIGDEAYTVVWSPALAIPQNISMKPVASAMPTPKQ